MQEIEQKVLIFIIYSSIILYTDKEEMYMHFLSSCSVKLNELSKNGQKNTRDGGL